jgi:hypothetical protein
MVRGDDSLSTSKVKEEGQPIMPPLFFAGLSPHLGPVRRRQALSMLRDARAAFELGVWLRNKNAEKFLRDCESELKSRFPKKCIA